MPSINFLPESTSQQSESTKTDHTRVYAIDAESANKTQRTGVEEYAYQLIEAMKQQPLLPGERVYLYSPTPLKEALGVLPDGWESQVLSWPLTRGWMQGRVSWEMWRRPPSVLFVPAQGLPHLTQNIPVLTTIHDIAFRRLPHLYDAAVRKRVTAVTKRSIKYARALLTVSQFSAQELNTLYHLPESKVTVTPLAANTHLFHPLTPEDIQPVLQSFRLGKAYFLFVGRLEAKKNVATLIQAFELFKARRGVGDPYELVLVGEPGFGFEEIRALIDASSYAPSIRQLGYVPSALIAALMNQATAYCFPSWYEGFGIPNVEAMACGTPLITSDIPVHHEVAGEAALFAVPNNAELWARQMTRVVDDPQVRSTLKAQGLARAAQFSWEQTATKTWEVLRSLVHS